MSTKTPLVLKVKGLTLPLPIEAATLRPTSLPWRIACWAVGGVAALPFLAGSGTAAASPIAQTLLVALDAQRAVDLDAAVLVERQAETGDDRMRA